MMTARQRLPYILLLCATLIGGALLPNVLSPLRAQMSSQQTWIAASGVGGSGNAITLTVPNVAQMADLVGVPLRWVATNTNLAGGTTANVNGYGATTVRRRQNTGLVDLAGGDFVASSMGSIIYDGTQFVIELAISGSIPVGMEAAFTNTAPLGWLTMNGTCVSQTTYAALYSYFGSTDLWSPGSTGGACSAGQFHLPYANGRTAVAYDTQGAVTANVLTNAGSSCAATAVGVTCGGQNVTLARSDLPNTNVTVTITDPGHIHAITPAALNGVGGAGLGGAAALGSTPNTASAFTGITAAFNLNGSVTQTLPRTVQPTYTVLKAVKY